MGLWVTIAPFPGAIDGKRDLVVVLHLPAPQFGERDPSGRGWGFCWGSLACTTSNHHITPVGGACTSLSP